MKYADFHRVFNRARETTSKLYIFVDDNKTLGFLNYLLKYIDTNRIVFIYLSIEASHAPSIRFSLANMPFANLSHFYIHTYAYPSGSPGWGNAYNSGGWGAQGGNGWSAQAIFVSGGTCAILVHWDTLLTASFPRGSTMIPKFQTTSLLITSPSTVI